MIFLLDRKGVILSANCRASAFFGSGLHLHSRNIGDFIPLEKERLDFLKFFCRRESWFFSGDWMVEKQDQWNAETATRDTRCGCITLYSASGDAELFDYTLVFPEDLPNGGCRSNCRVFAVLCLHCVSGYCRRIEELDVQKSMYREIVDKMPENIEVFRQDGVLAYSNHYE